MEQAWCIYNIDKKQVAEGLSGRLGDFFFDETPEVVPGGHTALISSLRTPRIPRQADVWLARGKTVQQRHGFGKLPVEILDNVLSYLDEIDLFMLALTCKAFLSTLRPRLLVHLKELHAPWQNCRLILLGSNTTRYWDLPPGVMSEEEWKEILLTRKHLSSSGLRPSLKRAGKQVYESALGRNDLLYYLRKHVPQGLRDEVLRGCGSGLGIWDLNRRTGDCWRFACLRGCGAPLQYPDGPPVLCNVSQGEYVREDSLTVPENMTLAHALLACIAWSTDPSIAMECSDEYIEVLTKGRWAGDRVCVVTLDTLPPSPANWTDVSADVDALLWDLFLANCSSDDGSAGGEGNSSA
ncbi:hypothetical protein BD414DRAFT_577653 [Trametes punicea]|nr:hypothetical protein BD414DRAFT_577653 [Trametes punicea]